MEIGKEDPLQLLIDDGSLRPRSIQHYKEATVLNIDLEAISESLFYWLSRTYYFMIRSRYAGAKECSREDFKAMVDVAMGVTYNRLRRVLKRYSPMTISTQMNRKAPIYNGFEFPCFISETLGSIGAIRLDDCAVDSLIVYSTSPDRMENFGRKAPPVWSIGRYDRILKVLKEIGVEMSRIDFENVGEGSCFPTIRCNVKVKNEEMVWTVFGTVHKSHYKNEEDIAKAMLLYFPKAELQPFEEVRITAEIEDSAAAAAAGLPADPQWCLNTPHAVDTRSGVGTCICKKHNGKKCLRYLLCICKKDKGKKGLIDLLWKPLRRSSQLYVLAEFK